MHISEKKRESEEQKERGEPDAASLRSADASPTLAMEKQGTRKDSGLVEVCKYNESSREFEREGGKREKKGSEREEERERAGGK